MQISLQSKVRQIAFFACVLLAVAGFVYLSSRAARAHGWSQGNEQWKIERAVKLEPQNADYWFRLGRWHLLMNQDSSAALNAYQRAVLNNPYNARFYIEIAKLGLLQGDSRQINQALDSALRVAPNTPSVSWDAANIYLAARQYDRALPLFRNASILRPDYCSSAMMLCWGATHDVNQMVAFALPPDVSAYGDFLRFLSAQHESTAAERIWQSLIEFKQPVPLPAAFQYLDFLLDQHKVREAATHWKELAATDANVSSRLAHDGNLVVNSGFEQRALNGGFDWRIVPVEDVKVTFSPSDFQSGKQSLLIGFRTSKSQSAGISQLIPVEPGTAYLLSLSYKANQLEGARGVAAVVSDAFTGQVLVSTDEFSGTTPWKTVSSTFTTGDSTSLLSLEFKHPGGTLILGDLLIDEVRLVKR
jgi:tetratricopeptide (TPR) repeat protein